MKNLVYTPTMCIPTGWKCASFPSAAPSEGVHIWAWDYLFSDETLDRCTSLLSSDERFRMQRLRFAKDRARYAVSHANLRTILGRYLDLPPSAVAFCFSHFGKPVLSPILLRPFNLNFNMSHTRCLSLLAISTDFELGIDVEEIRPIERDLADRHFSEFERAQLNHLQEDMWLKGFYNCWTRKEAILKAEGVGLHAKLDAFDVTLRPNSIAALLGYQPDSRLTKNWHLIDIDLSQNYSAALAISEMPRSIEHRKFMESSEPQITGGSW